MSSGLQEAVASRVEAQRERLVALKKGRAAHKLGDVTVGMCIGGMRGIPGMVWETSELDPEEGIRFRGLTIPECQARLPAAKEGGEPLPEGIFWLLMTGEVPTPEQVRALSQEWEARADLPAHVKQVLAAMPADTHPMTQLTTAAMAMQPGSKFARAYQQGLHKTKLWEPYFEDTMDLVARLPRVAAHIYRRTYKAGEAEIAPEAGLDWAGNLAHMMGYSSDGAKELMRLYQTIHCDHEGGNVSAHATHLVGSALSDPYLSYAAGMNGLAGPLHGLANQEVLLWLDGVRKELGSSPSKQEMTDFVWATLKAGKVVPGYGHAVLRKTDPRYTCQREFALKHLPEDELFRLVGTLYDVVPGILQETGKVANPWPNVDAHSGVLLQHYGIRESNYYTVLFGVSRALGVLAQGVWSRALGLPIERPKSLTMSRLEELSA